MNEQNNKPQYLTLEHADLGMGLSVVEQEKLNSFIGKAAEARHYRGLAPLQGVFVEANSPAFQDVMEVLQKYGLVETATEESK